VPELQPLDPAQVIMAEPTVPPGKRFCAHCNEALKRESGFCPKCGKPYSFVPALKPGDVVAAQYEVAGCLAFGGLGWIYLAKDKLLSRWVVLKGLLNAQDEAGAAAAVAERQFLAAVKHPNIVGVYNFAQRGSEGYIVMEYVGGKTLRALRKERGPLPLAEAIAYIHRILGAFAYLHRQEPPLVYCDFKPDNFMVEGDDVKLIDMGGVRRVDDPAGDIYGTKGYSAPEAGDGPTPVSDLFTVARTLAVLVADLRGFQSTFEFTLPPLVDLPTLRGQESLYRWLVKATRADPDERFQNADEMAEQLAGVLREIVAAETNLPRPGDSVLFGGDLMRANDADGFAVLPPAAELVPALKLDPQDPAAQFILANTGVAATAEQQAALFEGAAARYPQSAEVRLRWAGSLLPTGRFEEAEALLAALQAADPFDWRVGWYRGLAAFVQGKPADAATCFDAVAAELPGELAPKLAAALAAEAAGDPARAGRLYDIVSRTDPSFVTATFGLARCLALEGRRDEAAAAFGRVPAASRFYTRAQVFLARTWLGGSAAAAPGATELERASQAIEALTLDTLERHRFAAEIQGRALELMESHALADAPTVRVLGQPLVNAALRTGIERALRGMAHLVTDRAEKTRLVDLANQVRPKTWF
jgi:serine/threonine-protein kinase PknG